MRGWGAPVALGLVASLAAAASLLALLAASQFDDAYANWLFLTVPVGLVSLVMGFQALRKLNPRIRPQTLAYWLFAVFLGFAAVWTLLEVSIV